MCVCVSHCLWYPPLLIFPGGRWHFNRFAWPQIGVCVCVSVIAAWPPARTLLRRSTCLDNSGAHVGWNMAAVLVWVGEWSSGMWASTQDGSLVCPYIWMIDLGAAGWLLWAGRWRWESPALRGSQVAAFTPPRSGSVLFFAQMKETIQERSFTWPKIDTFNDVLIAS